MNLTPVERATGKRWHRGRIGPLLRGPDEPPIAEAGEKIELNSPFALEIGFTNDKFVGWLWMKDSAVWISFIESLQPGQGNLSALFNALWGRGFIIKVPTPSDHMREILVHYGFRLVKEWIPELEEYAEVHVKPF